MRVTLFNPAWSCKPKLFELAGSAVHGSSDLQDEHPLPLRALEATCCRT
jgi:hypothetical protein